MASSTYEKYTGNLSRQYRMNFIYELYNQRDFEMVQPSGSGGPHDAHCTAAQWPREVVTDGDQFFQNPGPQTRIASLSLANDHGIELLRAWIVRIAGHTPVLELAGLAREPPAVARRALGYAAGRRRCVHRADVGACTATPSSSPSAWYV